MRKKIKVLLLLLLIGVFCYSFKQRSSTEVYEATYAAQTNQLSQGLDALLLKAANSHFEDTTEVEALQQEILKLRLQMKTADFWLRYLEPIAYKSINGPLPVEWETEVFEKFEKPYKREGAGLTLAALYLEEPTATKDSFAHLIQIAIEASHIYQQDSITNVLQTFDHFYFCNRLYLLNLAAIYTTGFECPNTDVVINELDSMMTATTQVYLAFNKSFGQTPLTKEYLDLYHSACIFVRNQSHQIEAFDHFNFIKNYVNPLYALNQQLMLDYRAKSKSTQDYTLNKQANSIFSKALYEGQSSKGVFHNVRDEQALVMIDKLGKLLFYDPILSGNNERSCASCHNPKQFFTDTTRACSFEFNHTNFLSRNSPSLLNVPYNHLIMLDGAQLSLQNQTKAVLLNPKEMGAEEQQLVAKVLSCDEYKKGFTKLLAFTPQEPELSFDHIVSALTFYYSKFSNGAAPFDNAMNHDLALEPNAIKGFNLFMGKAQCATCHFVPQFNGVKPPYLGSEFEVLGTPANKDYTALSADEGRFKVHPAKEMKHAFRTGTLRNIMHTAPYMHNGVFKTINEVIDFYNEGGGMGHGLIVPNQTLSSDSLHLNEPDKRNLIAFLHTLSENVPFEEAPKKLPHSKIDRLNKRTVGGRY